MEEFRYKRLPAVPKAITDINPETCDLSAKNPHKKDEPILRAPKEILAEMHKLDEESRHILEKVKHLTL